MHEPPLQVDGVTGLGLEDDVHDEPLHGEGLDGQEPAEHGLVGSGLDGQDEPLHGEVGCDLDGQAAPEQEAVGWGVDEEELAPLLDGEGDGG